MSNEASVDSLAPNKIVVNNIDVKWDLDAGTVGFAGTPVAMLWVDSTLAHLMSGMQSMVGTERFGLALQSEGRNSVEGDWGVISSAESFEKGFFNISKIAAVAGWGSWKVLEINYQQQTAKFQVSNSWEGLYQKALNVCWGSAMVAGKFAGYASKLFNQHCWAEQISFIAKGDKFDEFKVQLSDRTIESEIEKLLNTDKATRADMAVALNKLKKEVISRKKAESEVRKLAYYDPLTGLPNRRYLTAQFERDISLCKRQKSYCALMFIDLDHFKTINDSLGHSAGDQLLIEITKRISSVIRKEDTLARIGGDEFILLLPTIELSEQKAIDNTTLIAQKIIEVISLPYFIRGTQYNITGSIGIKIIASDKQDGDECIKHADIALYKAKNSGRNQYAYFDPEMQLIANKQFALRHEIKNAIDANEFEVYYQPQFDNFDQIIGVEALVRWMHPEKGLVPAYEFIPLAEEHGLIYPIGKLVVEKSLAILKQWINYGLPKSFKKLAINVSAKQFSNANFVKEMSEVIIDSGVNSNLISFEITESLLLENIEDVINKINQLRKLGVRFSLDDFGTGFSSLSYLTKLPIDELKIDRAFISSLPNNSDDAIIVKTILSMAKHLNLQVVAEGVEEKVQLDFLKECGCCGFQGYLMSKPTPVKALESFGLFIG